MWRWQGRALQTESAHDQGEGLDVQPEAVISNLFNNILSIFCTNGIFACQSFKVCALWASLVCR
jgi:hypothetical protein